jgi:hypothetical protein
MYLHGVDRENFSFLLHVLCTGCFRCHQTNPVCQHLMTQVVWSWTMQAQNGRLVHLAPVGVHLQWIPTQVITTTGLSLRWKVMGCVVNSFEVMHLQFKFWVCSCKSECFLWIAFMSWMEVSWLDDHALFLPACLSTLLLACCALSCPPVSCPVFLLSMLASVCVCARACACVRMPFFISNYLSSYHET